MIDYNLALSTIVGISTVMVLFTIFLFWYYLAYFFTARRKAKEIPEAKEYTKFGVLIAARNESKVIRGIFESLKAQTYPKDFFDVWIIVESKDDPSCQIAEEYGYRYFVRDRLTNERRTKGFALQEIIDYFGRKNILYDAYMIFDADNTLNSDFIEHMNNVRQTGVKVATGYRNFTNANVNWLTSTSAVMFAYMNQVTSRGRSYLFHKATLMGTGYYVDRSVIEEAGGWIFTGMTEDIQLTAYCYYHDIYMRYYPKAVFFDEQSAKFKDVHNQHVRWLAGFFSSRRYLKKTGIFYDYHKGARKAWMHTEFRVGVMPLIIYNVLNALLLIASIVLSICAIFFAKDISLVWKCFGLTIYQFLVLYLPFVVGSSYILITERKMLNIKGGKAVLCVLTYFFFFYDFLWAFLDMIFHKKKRSSWVKIEHTGEKDKTNV